MAAKKGNIDDRAARSADASNEIQDDFLRVKCKLRAVLALLDVADESAEHTDHDIDAAMTLLSDTGESVEALEAKVVDRMRPRPVLQAT